MDDKKDKSVFFLMYRNYIGTVHLPVKGYDSVNLPSGLYKKVKALIEDRADLGYRSITEFVAEAVRKRIEEIETLLHAQLQLEEKVSKRTRKEKG